MVRPPQFGLAQLFKDICGIALALAVLRFSMIPGDDAYVLPAFGLVVGLGLGLPFRRAGEGASIGCAAFTALMHLLGWLQSPN
jgi:hypothetical protein